FQIWLNLPAESKMADPYFTMLWDSDIPEIAIGEGGAGGAVTVIAGDLPGAIAPGPPPDSWASRADSAVAIWHVRLEPGARWTMPAAPGVLAAVHPVHRMIYAFEGDGVEVGGEVLESGRGALLGTSGEVELAAPDRRVELLVLQGRPIAEPVAQYGPFVMNTRAEIQEAMDDYRRTGFGGWPWDGDDPVHPREQGRFARHPDGREEEPS
ncbi:MAG: pirin-like C-terminal cupin domain-containing protein, partial [Microthrixaceae bacterium]